MNNNTIFSVFIVKKDQDVLQIVQSADFEEAKHAWDSLVDQWTKCVMDRKPFIISNSVNCIAFDPGIISEISLKTTELTNRINPNNPYAQQMVKRGFSNTFGNFTQSTNTQHPAEELLDNGFNF